MSAPAPLRAAALSALDGVAHGFFTRRGGVSRGLYESLNCGPGSDDDPVAVAANRAAAVAGLGLGPAPLVTGRQVHGRDVLVVDGAPPPVTPRVDGLATATPGIVLGVLAADCAPVLLADAEAGVVAAAHAGWRGALAGIVEATVAAMVGLGARPARVRAAVGPCIAQASYEVGDDLRRPVLGNDEADVRHFRDGVRPGRWQFDLSGYVAGRLRAAGVTAIEEAGVDTCADAGRFFSYRRSRRRGDADYGRCLSAVALAR